MNKKQNSMWMKIADEVLNSGDDILLNRTTGTIKESYNGQISALGVSIAMNGLLPTLASYYNQSSETRTVDRRKILEVIGKMMKKKDASTDIENAETLVRAAIRNSNQTKLLQQEIIDCAIALKQVVRTYNWE